MSTKVCKLCKTSTTEANWARHLKTKKHITNANLVKPVKKSKPIKKAKPSQKELTPAEELMDLKKNYKDIKKRIKELEKQEEIRISQQRKRIVRRWMLTNEAYEEKVDEITKFISQNEDKVWYDFNGKKKNIFLSHRIQASSIEELQSRLRAVYYDETEVFKVNLVIGLVGDPDTIVMNLDDDKSESEIIQELYTIVHPGRNLSLFGQRNNSNGIPTKSMTIANKDDFEEFLTYVTAKNLEWIANGYSRPSSTFQIIGITDFWLETTRMGMMLGNADDITIPEDIQRSKAIITFPHAKNNLCFFYCITKALNPKIRTERMMTEVKLHLRKIYNGIIKDFEGVTLKQIDEFQYIIKQSINVYEYGESKDDINPLILSKYKGKGVIDILKYENHLMLITNRDVVFGKYQCEGCLRFFHSAGNVTKHRQNGQCKKETSEQIDQFPIETTAWMTPRSDLYMLLLAYNLHETLDTKLDNILTWDFEASTNKINTPEDQDDKKLKYIGQQVPMSYSIAYRIGDSNIKKCTKLLDDFAYDPVQLVQSFIDKIVQISIKSFEFYCQKYKQLINRIKKAPTSLKRFINAVALPCIGFNSGSYDTKLLTHFGLYQMLMKHESWKNIFGFDYSDDLNCFIIPEKIIAINHVRMIDQILFTQCSLEMFINNFHPDKSLSGIPFPEKSTDFNDLDKSFTETNYPYSFFFDKPNQESMYERIFNVAKDKSINTYRDYLILHYKGKLDFPHSKFEFMKHSDLEFNQDNFPEDFFYNDLKDAPISKFKYNSLFVIAEAKKVKTMRDFLVLYNECDVVPFLKSCEVCREELRKASIETGIYIEPYNETIGAPTFSSKLMINLSQKEYLKEFEDIWKLKPIQQLSIEYNDEKYQKMFQSYKAQDMKAKWKRDTNFSKKWVKTQLKSQGEKCYTCHKSLKKFTLDRINNDLGHVESNMVITCKICNIGRKLGSIFIQEYNFKMNSFSKMYKDKLLCVLGDKHQDLFNLMRQKGVVGGPSMVFHRYHKTNETNIQHTIINENNEYDVQEAGKKVEFIASHDANAMYPKAYSGDMPCGEPTVITGKTKQLIEEINNDIHYGFVYCSLKVRTSHYEKYLEHPPFYVTKLVDGELKLTSYMEVEDMFIATDLFKWYINSPGIKCTNINQVVLFKRAQPFKTFVDMVAEKRRDPNNKLSAEIWKLASNSAFGKMGQNNNAYNRNLFTVDLKKANMYINKPEFIGGNEYTTNTDTLYELTLGRKKVNQNMPLHGSCMIYSLSKLLMLKFVYDFLDKYISRKDYQLMYSDTDSMWIAFSKANPFGLPKSLAPKREDENYPPTESLIRKSMQEKYEQEKHQYLVFNKYDERTPGLFKVEYEASELVCLSAKSYYATPAQEKDGVKKGAKGIQKRNALTLQIYKDALNPPENYVPHTALNKGFRFVTGKNKDLGLQLYEQRKVGVTATYTKRGLLENGINTYPISWDEIN